MKIIIGDKGYDSEENHVIAKKSWSFSNNTLRNEDVPIHLKGKTERGWKGICQNNTKEGQ